MDKLWGRIWGQGDQNWGFGVENSGFPRGKTPRAGLLFWCMSPWRQMSCRARFPETANPIFVVSGIWGPIRAF